MQILIHHHGTDRHAIGRSETSVLHINRNGDLRIIHWSEAHEHGVVFSTILGRPRLSTNGYSRQDSACHTAGSTPCTAIYSSPHTFHHFFIILPVNGRISRSTVNTVQFIILYLLHDMRSNKIPAIGYSCTQIGYLQGSSKNFALPDRNTYHRQAIPRTPVCLIVKFGIRYQPPLLSGEIRSKTVTETL